MGAEKTAIHQEVVNTSLAAGSNTLSTTPVAANKIQRITSISFSYTGTVTGVRFEVKAGGITVFKSTADPVSGQLYSLASLQGAATELWLSAGEKIDLVVTGATLNDDALLDVHGVQFATY